MRGASLLLEPLPAGEHDVWDSFVAEAETGTLFHTAWWHRAWGSVPEILARRGQDGRIEAGLPLFRHRFQGAEAIVRPPFTPFNGPVFRLPSAGSTYERNQRVKEELFAALASFPRAELYVLAPAPQISDVSPFLWCGFRSMMEYTYVIPKAKAPCWKEDLSANCRRNLIRARAESGERGCFLEVDPPVGEIEPLLLETARRKRCSTPDRLAPWWEEVRSRQAGRIYLVRNQDGVPLCATVAVWDTRTTYYLLAGMRDEVRLASRLNALLFERMIEEAHGRGHDFDFEGSRLPGVERFFRGWGGELRPVFCVVRASSRELFRRWEEQQEMPEPGTEIDTRTAARATGIEIG